MNKQAIKTELIKRAEALAHERYAILDAAGDGALGTLSNRLKGTDGYAQDITTLLNDIIKEQGVNLTDPQKTELVEFIKPVMRDLLIAYIKRL